LEVILIFALIVGVFWALGSDLQKESDRARAAERENEELREKLREPEIKKVVADVMEKYRSGAFEDPLHPTRPNEAERLRSVERDDVKEKTARPEVESEAEKFRRQVRLRRHVREVLRPRGEK
jgi:hypothetical protein